MMKILRGSYVALAAQLLHKNMSVVQNIFRVNAKSEARICILICKKQISLFVFVKFSLQKNKFKKYNPLVVFKKTLNTPINMFLCRNVFKQ